ncbi:aspartate/glutamate racemase family protein [Roseibium sp. SCP14]|uniref:aspartate/glutamate racemase family protein n=1 Tax=Roseibium sp. SCP14 TaxID=3141375 RepID=UPI00333A75FD
MTDSKRTIGVLGGMGPEATILFMQKVVQAVPASDDADHIPLIVDNNTQVPSRIKALIEGTGVDPAPTLADMARRLEKAGASALAMPCNTAHNYQNHIRSAVEVPFLSMVDLTAEHIFSTSPGARVGILASPAVRMTEIYETPLSARGLKTIYPRQEDRVLSSIKALKVSAVDAAARESVREVAMELESEGCEVLLVGCTEFSLLADELKQRFNIVDSLDVLVEAAVSFSLATAANSAPQNT